jgi:hypothetical protein
MHEKPSKIWSYTRKQNIFFVFLKDEINLIFLIFFKNFYFLRNFWEKTKYFNIGSVSYNVNI